MGKFKGVLSPISSATKELLKKRLWKHKDTYEPKLLWASQSLKQFQWLLSGVSCSLSINRTYDSSPVPYSLQIDECPTEEIHQEDKIVIRWHHKKSWRCWRWQEHKTLEQNRCGSKGFHRMSSWPLIWRRSFTKIVLIFSSLPFSIFSLICLMTCLCCNIPNIFTLINAMLKSH